MDNIYSGQVSRIRYRLELMMFQVVEHQIQCLFIRGLDNFSDLVDVDVRS